MSVGFDPEMFKSIEFLAARQDKSFAQKVRELCEQSLKSRRIRIAELTHDQYWDFLPGAPFAGGFVRHAYTEEGRYWAEIELPEEKVA